MQNGSSHLITTGVKWAPELAREIQKQMDEILGRYCRPLLDAVFEKERHKVKFPAQTAATNFSIRTISSRQRILAETNLFAASLEAQTKSEANQHTVIHACAPVGAIHTGPNSHSDIVQHFGESDRTELMEVCSRGL